MGQVGQSTLYDGIYGSFLNFIAIFLQFMRKSYEKNVFIAGANIVLSIESRLPISMDALSHPISPRCIVLAGTRERSEWLGERLRRSPTLNAVKGRADDALLAVGRP